MTSAQSFPGTSSINLKSHQRVEASEPKKRPDELAQEILARSQLQRQAIVEELSYGTFLSRVMERPELFLRNSAGYLADAIDSYGRTKVKRLGREIEAFHCLSRPWLPEHLRRSECVIGQEVALYDFYTVCRALGREAGPRKQIIVHGQPGSGKTSLFETIVEAAEEYSRSNPEGALYRLAFKVHEDGTNSSIASVFGWEREASINSRRTKSGELRLESGWNTDPLFLLGSRRMEADIESPREALVNVLRSVAASSKKPINIDYALKGELDPFSARVFEDLVRYYKGDVQAVFQKHVVVERWIFNRTRGEGINEVGTKSDPRGRREAAHVPPAFSSTHAVAQLEGSQAPVFKVISPITRSNRGIHIHTDMLRVAPGADVPTIGGYNHLLDMIEHGKYEVDGAIGHLGVLFLGTTTSLDVYRGMENKGIEWPSLDRRTVFVTVPNIRRAEDEQKLVRRALERHALSVDRAIDPHVERMLALFTVASRTFPPDAPAIVKEHSDLDFVKDLTLLEKVILLDGSEGVEADAELNIMRENSRTFSSKHLRRLRAKLDLIAEQFQAGVGKTRFVSYEGGSGIPPSETAGIVAELAQFVPSKSITVMDVLRFLEKRCEGGFAHYSEVERYREGEIRKAVAKARRSVVHQGNVPDEKQIRSIRAEAEKKFDAEWRFPRAKDVLSQIEKWAKGSVVRDVKSALDRATNTKGSPLERYLSHLRATLVPGTEVPMEHRESRMNRSGQPDESFMVPFENMAAGGPDHLKTAADRSRFRQEVFHKVSNAGLDHGGEWVTKNLPQLFPDIARNLEVSSFETEARKKDLRELVQNVQRFEDPAVLETAQADKAREREVKIYLSVMEFLEKERHYPKDAIAKLVTWACPAA